MKIAFKKGKNVPKKAIETEQKIRKIAATANIGQFTI